VVAGDVTVNDAYVLARRAFGDWGGAAPARVEAADAPRFAERRVHLVAKGDAAQSELRVGHVGVPRSHPDYFAITVMNAVLGGLFSSRINLNLREVHGYTYGASSGVDWRRAAGPFVVSSAVQSDVTADAAREVLLEIDRMRSEAISESELTLATSYLDGVFPIRYETTAAIAGALANLVLYELPEDYFTTYREHVRSVTALQVLRAAQEHLYPERLQLLVVGDPGVVRGPLAELGFGPMREYDVEGREVAA
jgi:zinc protease